MREACSSQTMLEMHVSEYHFVNDENRSLMAMHLAFNLQRNRFLQKLVLSMDPAGTLAVVGALRTHPTLRSLTITYVFGGMDIVPALVQLLESNQHIRALHLRGTIQGIGALCQACGTLAELSVACGDLHDDKPFALLIATSQNLRDLRVTSNPFGGAAHIALALGQKQTRLRSLDVARCGFQKRSAALHFVSTLETSNFILTDLNHTIGSADLCVRLQRVLARNAAIRSAIQAAMYALIGCGKHNNWPAFNRDLRVLIFSYLLSEASAWQHLQG